MNHLIRFFKMIKTVCALHSVVFIFYIIYIIYNSFINNKKIMRAFLAIKLTNTVFDTNCKAIKGLVHF